MVTQLIVILILVSSFSNSLCEGINYLTMNATNYNLNEPNVPLSPELQELSDLYTRSIARRGRLACLFQIRNFLAAENDTNLHDIYSTIKVSKFDPSLTFNKIISMMAVNCRNKITEKMIDEIFIPIKLVMLMPNFLSILTFDKSYFNTTQNITFSSEEQEYLKEIFEEGNVENVTSSKEIHSNNKIKEDFSELISKEFYLFGVAITKPYVQKYVVIGAGVTSLVMIFLIWITCCCCGERKSDVEESHILKSNKKNK